METTNGLKARQIRAARALLDWSQDDLARESHLSIATVRKIEAGHISARGKTTISLRRAFEDAGLEFIEPEGVRLQPDEVTVFHGPDGVLEFLDDVYHTMIKAGGDIVVVTPSEHQFATALGKNRDFHFQRMTEAQGFVKVKCILTEDPSDTPARYCDYRFLPKDFLYSVPFYVYHNKFAMIVFPGRDRKCKITVIQSPSTAEAYRQQFYSMWEKATPLASATPATKMRRDGNR